MRAVFDTNVIISAALFEHSKPALALKKAFIEGDVLFSKDIEKELEEIFFRRKFDPYLTIEERTEFLHSFFQQSSRVEVTQTVTICRDPKDNMILDLAVNGQADVIITGDKDLLDLNPCKEILIVTPNDFLDYFKTMK